MLTSEEWTAVLLSLRVASVATAISLPIGLAAALAMARWRFPGRSLVDAAIFLPLVLPPVVTGYLLLVVFGTQGPVGHALKSCCGIVLAFRWTGAALAAGVMGFPLIVRSIRLSIEATDRRLETAAATLGANPVTVFFTVTLPLAMPGVIAGAIIGFAKALGEFGATITFASNIPGETQTIPLAIYAYTSVPDDGGATARLATISIVLAVGAVVVSEWLVRRWAPTPRRI